jgi:hypothetical protein
MMLAAAGTLAENSPASETPLPPLTDIRRWRQKSRQPSVRRRKGGFAPKLGEMTPSESGRRTVGPGLSIFAVTK